MKLAGRNPTASTGPACSLRRSRKHARRERDQPPTLPPSRGFQKAHGKVSNTGNRRLTKRLQPNGPGHFAQRAEAMLVHRELFSALNPRSSQRALALPRNHCRVQMASRNARMTTDDRGQPGYLHEPQRQPRPPRQHAHMIDLRRRCGTTETVFHAEPQPSRRYRWTAAPS